MSDTRLPPPTSDAPTVYPLTKGIETTVFVYPKKVDKPLMNDTTKKATSSTTSYYHDCGGEWKFSGSTEWVDGATWYRAKCAGCGAYGRAARSYPVTKTL